MADDLDDQISDKDWQTFDYIRDLPFHLWDYFREDFLGERAKLPPHERRIRFKLIDADVELDPRLLARLYRGFWARVLFPSETGTTLRDFVTKETKRWPQRTASRKMRHLPNGYPRRVKVVDFIRQAGERFGPHDFERLLGLFADGEFETNLYLFRVEPKNIDRLIEFGDVPPSPKSLIAAMVFTYIQAPNKYPGIPYLLDDNLLPDFGDDENPDEELEPNYPRMHFARRTHHTEAQGPGGTSNPTIESQRKSDQ